MLTMQRDPQHCYSHFVPFSLEYNYDSDDEEETILSYLKNANADLRWGDLIVGSDHGYRNNDVRIYNGEEIVDLYDEIDDYGSLPSEFHIIENNIPIRYWYNIDDDSPTKRGIDHNSIVWVKTSLIRPYLSTINDDGIIYMKFTYNNENYYIIFDFDDKPSLVTVNKFVSTLNTEEVIPLNFISQTFAQDQFTQLGTDKILYWRS